MEKINLAKFININNSKKTINHRVILNLPEDKFIKKEAAMDSEKYINTFSNCNYKNISNKLIENGRWTDGFNMIAYNKVDGKISSVSIASPEIGEIDCKADVVTIDEFVDILTHVTANKIKINPEKENFYKNTFVDVLNHLNKNKYTK